MPKHTDTTQSSTFQPASMNAYTALQAPVETNLHEDMHLDPTQSATYNLALQHSLNAAGQIGDRNTQQVMGNIAASGMNPTSAYMQSQLARTARGNSAIQSNAYLTNLLHYDEMRRQAVAQAQGYRPLQTGANTSQNVSGVGSWLPQVAAAGIGAAGDYLKPATNISVAPTAASLSNQNLTGSVLPGFSGLPGVPPTFAGTPVPGVNGTTHSYFDDPQF